MLKRKVLEELQNFKKDRSNGLQKALMVKGARQVGKSFIIREFGRNEYESFIEINFYENPIFKNAFTGELTSEEILKRLSAYIPDLLIVPGKTLIFLDEIQYCGNARTAIKFLVKDFRFDIIESGSLLGLTYGKGGDSLADEPRSIPVGYERHIKMHSLDFEEFLWAYGYKEDFISLLKEDFNSGSKIYQPIYQKVEYLFQEFMVVGGMPEVVNDFIINKDFNRVDKIQKDILSTYYDDIAKHASTDEKAKIRRCYDSIPKQLMKEFKKYQYSNVEKGQTSRKYGSSIQWLIDSDMIEPCYNVRSPLLPLLGNSDESSFKLYFSDTGLLSCIYGLETKRAILSNTLTGNIKGAIFENIIAECLVKNTHKLYYYRPNNDMEIEFLIEKNLKVIPIEVKANNGRSTSLNLYIKKFSPDVSYKLISGSGGVSGTKTILPHFFIMFL